MAKYERFFVDSSFLKHVAWESESKSLIITFSSGSIWMYKEVPKKVYNRFCSSKSLGKYFNEKIRNFYEGIPIARVGQSSVIIYSEGDEIVKAKEEKQE